MKRSLVLRSISVMDYSKLAKRHLEDALSKGYLTLDNGDIKELKASEILAVSKYVVKEGWVSDETSISDSLVPNEMFSLKANNYIELDLDDEVTNDL